MGEYRLTKDAGRDLTEIRGFTLREWGKEQSRQYIVELRKTLTLLSDNPLIGSRRSDIGEGIYSFPSASHVIYYLLEKNHLIVIGILHGSMVPANHLEGRISASEEGRN